MSNEQRNVAIVGNFAHRVEQRIGARGVETIGDLDPIL
jgi:hypothetical protein